MIDRIKLGYWHSAVGNKVNSPPFLDYAYLFGCLKDIYLVEVAATVDKKKLPNDWTKSGGTKVRFGIGGQLSFHNSYFRLFRLRAVMLSDLCKNVSDNSKRHRKTVPPLSKNLNSAFTRSSTQTARCG